VIKLERMRWAGHVAWIGYNILVGNPEGKGPLGKRRPRWEHNTRMDLWE